jgi:hypothetical protein
VNTWTLISTEEDVWSEVLPTVRAWATGMHVLVDNKAAFVLELPGDQNPYLLFYKDGMVYLGPSSEAINEQGGKELPPYQPYAFDSGGLQVLADFMEENESVFDQFQSLLKEMSNPHLVNCRRCHALFPMQACIGIEFSGERITGWSCYGCMTAVEQERASLLHLEGRWDSSSQIRFPWQHANRQVLYTEWKSLPRLQKQMHLLSVIRLLIPQSV